MGNLARADYISTDTIILANSGSPTNQWFNEEILSTAPAGAVEARVSLIFRQVSNASGSVYIDNVELEVAPRESTLAPFASNFDDLIPSSTIGDGWRFTNTNGPLSPYSGLAPNGPQICTLSNDGAGNQFLNMFADYDNQFMPTETLTLHVYQEQSFTADDAERGETWNFDFDYARAINPFGPGGATTTGAFIRVFDDNLDLLREEVFPTTAATGPAYSRGSVSLSFDPSWTTGGTLQFGFTSTVTNYQPSGVYYDNLDFSKVVSPTFVLGDANGDGGLSNLDVALFVMALTSRGAYEANVSGNGC